MSDTTGDEAARFAERHGLDVLRAADPDRFAALLAQTATTGAALPRHPEKEFPPAPSFRPKGSAA